MTIAVFLPGERERSFWRGLPYGATLDDSIAGFWLDWIAFIPFLFPLFYQTVTVYFINLNKWIPIPPSPKRHCSVSPTATISSEIDLDLSTTREALPPGIISLCEFPKFHEMNASQLKLFIHHVQELLNDQKVSCNIPGGGDHFVFPQFHTHQKVLLSTNKICTYKVQTPEHVEQV